MAFKDRISEAAGSISGTVKKNRDAVVEKHNLCSRFSVPFNCNTGKFIKELLVLLRKTSQMIKPPGHGDVGNGS